MKKAIIIVLKVVFAVVCCAIFTFIPCAMLMAMLHAANMDKEAYTIWGVLTAIIAVPTVIGIIGAELIDYLPIGASTSGYVSSYSNYNYDDDGENNTFGFFDDDDDSYSFFGTKSSGIFDEDEDDYLWGPEDFDPYYEDPEPWEYPNLDED